MFALDGLAPVDGWAAVAILAKALGYAAALLAMGGALFLAVHERDLAPAGSGSSSGGGMLPRIVPHLRRLTAAAAFAGLAVLALRFAIRAARVSGMGLEGAADPVMLGLVWDSPLGAAAAWRAGGAALVLFVLVPGLIGRWVPILGAVLIAVSYSVVGHSLGEPRWALASLLVLHLLAVAFWVGALVPLRRAARSPYGAAVLHRFGTVASGAVPLLVAVGASFAWLLSGSVAALFGTAYGWVLIAKIAAVAALLSLAARNKLDLVPALARGEPSASSALRRSIEWEGAAIAVILLATAALTTITTPPAKL